MATTPGPDPKPDECTGCGTTFDDCDAGWQRIAEVCCDDCRDTTTDTHDGIVPWWIDEKRPAVMA
jgi:hypothetical protein